MLPIPHPVTVRYHPGSALQEVMNEPAWGFGHNHRVGFRNKHNRLPGLTHSGDEHDEDWHVREDIQASEAAGRYQEFREEVKKGKLVSFRDIVNAQEDFHLRRPDVHSEEGPANVERTQKEEAKKKKEEEEKRNNEQDKKSPNDQDIYLQQGHERESEENKGRDDDAEDIRGVEHEKHGYEVLREKYSPQEIALLFSLQHEKDYISNLEENNGRMKSPVNHSNPLVSIDEADQSSPDNWIPRSSDLIRLTGKHPLNCEPKLALLFEAGLITPNELHYVRNHGSVPHIPWELHKLQIYGLQPDEKLEISMDELAERFDTISIPVPLACDGNRRKELNMIKRSIGFNWGSGAVACSYWKGPLLHDVLLAAGILEKINEGPAILG
ncbi:molybdopterin binding oxidoreductase [Cadophora sp. DSE1049]|nr:molybdopterin binding oxidoreductase [Cadophora sp. DSE1049]